MDEQDDCDARLLLGYAKPEVPSAAGVVERVAALILGAVAVVLGLVMIAIVVGVSAFAAVPILLRALVAALAGVPGAAAAAFGAVLVIEGVTGQPRRWFRLYAAPPQRQRPADEDDDHVT